jgi:hypothetical protein
MTACQIIPDFYTPWAFFFCASRIEQDFLTVYVKQSVDAIIVLADG